MDIGAAFSSTYLKASDIPEGPGVTVKIDRVEIEDVGQKGKKEEKPVAFFVGKEKGMVLNKTNAKTISKAYGVETDNWHGKPVQIFRTEVEFQGDMVDALRIRIPKAGVPANGGGQHARPAPRIPADEPPVSEEQVFDEADIPF